MPMIFFKRRRRFEKRQTGIATLCGLIITVTIAILYVFGLLGPIEFSLSDWLMRLRGPLPPPSDIAIIEIGQESIGTIQKWPIPRDVYARLVRVLADAGARSVGISIMFPEQSTPAADNDLAAAIRKAGMVYLPCYFEIIPSTSSYRKPVDNIPLLRDAAKGEGHINMPADNDGIVRRTQLCIGYEGARYLQFAFLMACDRLGVAKDRIDLRGGRSMGLTTGSGERIAIPLDARGAMVIDWNGPWRKAFNHYSAADILEAADRITQGLRPRIQLSELKGRICLVGLTAPGTFDATHTPVEPLAPSVAIHATIISQILQGRLITVVSGRMNLFIILLLGLGASITFPRLKPAVGIIAMLAACALYLLLAMLIFSTRHTQVAIAYPLAVLILSYFAISIHHEIAISFERSRLHHLATRDGLTNLYVIGHFRLLLNAEMTEAQRAGKPLSLIMTDIDLFKQFNDTYGHQEGDAILREAARVVIGACRELDLVGRYGGEEFIVLLPNAVLGEARAIAERMRRAVEARPFAHGGERYRVTISLGVAQLSPLDAAEDLIRRADEALYDAKRAGRNRVCVKELPGDGTKVLTIGRGTP